MSMPHFWLLQAALFAFSLLASAALCALVLRELRRRSILDHPNTRSSHDIPTPRGGGLGVVPVVVAAWAISGWLFPGLPGLAAALAAATALAMLSWLDDLHGLSPLLRLLAQAVAVAVALGALPVDIQAFQGWLPLWADRLLVGLALLWFVNLFNFMDGIDGITGMELACIGAGVAVVPMLSGVALQLVPYGVVLTGGGLGFLVWNWRRAKIFLGDVGSVPLGFLAGWLLIQIAAAGFWLPALIVPLYYLLDTTCTLVRRLLRGEQIWRPHREHFYQRAVQGGMSHAAVVTRILGLNFVLISLAAASIVLGGWIVVPALTAVVLLLRSFSRVGRGAPIDPLVGRIRL